MPENIELEDRTTHKKVTVPLAHYRRWKTSLDVSFRPVAEKKTTAPVAATPAPVGDQTKEN
jgi:hypothetical protein